MATSIIMPKAEMAMEEGTVVRWRVREGDAVARGQPVVEIETDKATMDVEAEADGVLLKIVEPDGRRVPVTAVLGWIGRAGEAVPETNAPAAVAPAAGPAAEAPTAPPPTRVPATPAAKRMARERGVDLAAVFDAASGRPVRAADVVGRGAPAPEAAVEAEVKPDPSDRVVPLTSARRATARRMVEAHRRVPAVTLHTRADVTELAGLRERLQRAEGLRITYNDLVLKAVATALPDFPELNAVFLGDRLLLRGRVHLSVAVATDRGLVAPVVQDADRRTLADLAREARRMAELARAGGLRPADLEGGTFTVSNVGRFGITAFTPILNLPQTAILGVGAIEEAPRLADGGWVVRRLMGLSLTFDHRAMDGVPPSAFLARLCELLQDPGALAGPPVEVLPEA